MASGNFEATTGGLTLSVSWRSLTSPITNSSTVTMDVWILHKNAIGAKTGHTVKCGTQSRTFSSSAQPAEDMETLVNLAHEDFVVTHNNDGTKKVTLSASFKMNANYGGTYIGTITASKEVTLDNIPRQSSIALLTESVEVNGENAVILTLKRGNNAYKHTVTFAIGDYSHTVNNIDTMASYVIPKDWLFAVPKSSGTATVEITTYSGEVQIGDVVYGSFTLIVPEDIVPVIGSILWTKTSNEPSSWPMTQNVSQGILSMEDTHGEYGGTIASYELEFAGLRSTSSKLTVNNIQSSGKLTATARVTDTRGRSAEKQVDFDVTPYTKPTLVVSVYRCDEEGNENPQGEYIYVQASSEVTVVGNNALQSLIFGYRQHGGFEYKEEDLTSGVAVWFEASSDYSWDWFISTTDLAHTVTETGLLSTGAVVLDILYNGRGIGIGKVAENEGLDSFWQFQHNGTPMVDFVVETGTSGFLYYRKWNSGDIECYGISEEMSFDLSRTYGSVEYYDITTLSLPSDLFTSVTYAEVSSIGNLGLLHTPIRFVTPEEIAVYVSNSKTGTFTLRFSVNIKGRWK